MKNITASIIGACLVSITAPALSAQNLTTSLKELQTAILKHEHLCRAAAVGITDGGAGSGVIISADGIILTAGHVAIKAGQDITVVLSDGARVKAVCLLYNMETDSAICKITDEAPEGGWKHRPIRVKKELVQGDWCTVISHGGGVYENRQAPLRVGRVLRVATTRGKRVLTTDCTVIAGDSGGPLFDIDGNVCGVNSAGGMNNILANIHVSTATFIDQWGAYLTEGKKLPSVQEAKSQAAKSDPPSTEAETKPASKLPARIRPSMKRTFKEQYPELPEELIEMMLDTAILQNKMLTVPPNPEINKAFKDAGFEPSKYLAAAPDAPVTPPQKPTAKEPSKKKTETAEEAIRKRFGDINEQAMAYLLSKVKNNNGKHAFKLTVGDLEKLKELGVDVLDIQSTRVITKKFGKISPEAMALLKKRIVSGPKGLAFRLLEEDVETLKKMGVDVTSKKKKPESARRATLTKAYRKQYGADLSDEVLDILISATIFNKKTGQVRMELTEEQQDELVKLGFNLFKQANGAKADDSGLGKLVKVYGDSTTEVRKQFPQINQSITVAQDGKRIGLATPIREDGLLLCKASSLKGDSDVTITVNGSSLKAEVLSEDESSDLALLKVTSKLKTLQWSKATPELGRLLVSTTEAEPMLAVVSLNIGATPSKEGKPDDSRSQKMSEATGELSPRRMDFPECITHDAIMWNDDCGGPVYSLDGKVVGINIARYDRATNYALTLKSVVAAFKRLSKDK